MNAITRRQCTAIVFAAGLSAATAAENAPANPPGGDVSPGASGPIKLDAVVVTGSHIPTAADAVAVPVVIIGQPEIEQTGKDANLLDILRERLPQITSGYGLGNANAGTGIGATLGGSVMGLRNFPVLVLINGRRLATSGAAATGGRDFVDLNQVPVAAIERVEVLTDGASAIYGADAMGGVVNIILKSDYRSVEASMRFAFAAGGYTERSSSLVFGVGSRNGALRLTTALSWAKTDPLFQYQRPFSRTVTGLSTVVSGAVGSGGAFPTHQLNPALNSPRERNPVGAAATATSFAQLVANGTYVPTTAAAVAAALDLAPDATQLIGQDQRSTALNSTFRVPKSVVTLFADYMHTETRSFSQLAANPINTIPLPAGAAFNPLSVAFPTYGFRYLPAPRQFINESRLDRVTAGARVDLTNDWTTETGATWTANRLPRRVRNLAYTLNLNRAIAGGYNAQGQPVRGGAFSRVVVGFSESSPTFVIQPALDVLARPGAIDPASLENVFGTAGLDYDSRLATFDAKLTGPAIALPAGKVRWAFGAEHRREQLVCQPDENSYRTGPTAGRWLGGAVTDPFDVSRHVNTAFGEMRVPIAGERRSFPGAHALDLTAAWRLERYSDVGGSNVPKFGLRWQPIDAQWTLRATHARSFTSTSLWLLHGPQTRAFVPAAVLQRLFGVTGQAQVVSGANPELNPYTTKSVSAGVAVSPRALKGLTLSVNYSDTDFTGHEASLGAEAILQSVNALGPQSPLAGRVTFGAFPGEPAARPVTRAGEIVDYLRAGGLASNIHVSNLFANAGAWRIRTLDMRADYAPPKRPSGQWRFGTSGTFFLRYGRQDVGEPMQEYAGVASSRGTFPGYRFHSTAEWSRGAWGALVANTWISSVTDLGPGGAAFGANPALRRQHVSGYLSWDFAVSREFRELGALQRWAKSVRLTAGVKNAFDRMPPLAKQAFSADYADLTTYSPIGRLGYVRAQMKF